MGVLSAEELEAGGLGAALAGRGLLRGRLISAVTAAKAANPLTTGVDTITSVLQSSSTDSTFTNSYNLANSVASSPITYIGGDGYTPFGSTVRASVPGGGGAGGVAYETFIDGSVVEFQLEAVSGKEKFQIIVDDRFVGTGAAGSVVPTLFSTADGPYVKLTFSTPGPHLIRIEREGLAGLSGMRTLPFDGALSSFRDYPVVSQFEFWRLD